MAGVLIAVSLVCAAPIPGAEMQPWMGTRIQEALLRLNRVAGLYRDTALNFSCHERITYDPQHSPPKIVDLEYIYYHDEQKGLMDYRTRSGPGSGKGKPAPEVLLTELPVPTLVMRAYSTVFIFQKGRAESYKFSIVRDEKLIGRDAMVIRFDAIPPYRRDDNDWFGEAWIDRATYQPLKIEALKADQLEEKRRLEADLANPPATRHMPSHVIEKVTTEFFVEKNGMRFPSRVVTRRSLFQVKLPKGGPAKADEDLLFEVEQAYSDYRFYGVKTSEQIQDLVNGPAAGKPPL